MSLLRNLAFSLRKVWADEEAIHIPVKTQADRIYMIRRMTCSSGRPHHVHPENPVQDLRTD